MIRRGYYRRCFRCAVEPHRLRDELERAECASIRPYSAEIERRVRSSRRVPECDVGMQPRRAPKGSISRLWISPHPSNTLIASARPTRGDGTASDGAEAPRLTGVPRPAELHQGDRLELPAERQRQTCGRPRGEIAKLKRAVEYRHAQRGDADAGAASHAQRNPHRAERKLEKLAALEHDLPAGLRVALPRHAPVGAEEREAPLLPVLERYAVELDVDGRERFPGTRHGEAQLAFGAQVAERRLLHDRLTSARRAAPP